MNRSTNRRINRHRNAHVNAALTRAGTPSVLASVFASMLAGSDALSALPDAPVVPEATPAGPTTWRDNPKRSVSRGQVPSSPPLREVPLA